MAESGRGCVEPVNRFERAAQHLVHFGDSMPARHLALLARCTLASPSAANTPTVETTVAQLTDRLLALTRVVESIFEGKILPSKRAITAITGPVRVLFRLL